MSAKCVLFQMRSKSSCPPPFTAVRNRSQPSVRGLRASSELQDGYFWNFQCFVASFRVAGVASHMFHNGPNVSKVVLCDRRNTIASFSKDELQFLDSATLWRRASCFCVAGAALQTCRVCRFFANRILNLQTARVKREPSAEIRRGHEKKRLETRHVGASKGVFRARRPQIFTVCSCQIDAFLGFFMNSEIYDLKIDVSCKGSVSFPHILQNATPAKEFGRCSPFDAALTLRFAKRNATRYV